VSYNLKRATVSGGPYNTISTGISGTSTVDNSVTNGTTYYYVVSGVNGAGEGPNSNQASATPAVTLTPVFQVNAGGSAAAPYQADAFFNGGRTSSTTVSIDVSRVVNPAPVAVYQSWREAPKKTPSFSYTLTGLTAGAPYTVRLHFAENEVTRAGARRFNVSINGTQVLSNFDVFAAAGAANRALIETFTANANGSGQIVIGFTSVTTNQGAFVNGIEILH
jgi:hypothetical protein